MNQRKKTVPQKQPDPFAPTQIIPLNLPPAFLLLCKLWGVEPRLVLINFMHNLGCGSWVQQGRDGAQAHLKNYALEMGYGSNCYTKEEIKQMFAELDAIGRLFPDTADTKMLNLHLRWRKAYYNHWYKKWKK